jgi:hypothetical protein
MAIKTAFLVAVAAVTLSLTGCASGFKATYDYDPAHDFTGHQSWAWISKNPMTVLCSSPASWRRSRIILP